MSAPVATGPSRAARPSRWPGHVPGETGVWVFIFGDLLVFAVLFATYLYYRGQGASLFAASQRELTQAFGAVNTLLLLVSSLLVAAAVRAARGDAPRLAPRLVAGAMACGVAFSALKAVEWTEKLSDGLNPGHDEFFMYYFVLTGLHWFHLIVGVAVLGIVLRLVSRPDALTPRRLAFVEGGACYWHMVDLLWIVLFPLLYLVH